MCPDSPIDLSVFVEIPFISDDAFELDMPSTGTPANLSGSEDAAPQLQPIHQTSAQPKLLHGRSPLGLTTPIVADDLNLTNNIARPARVLQLITDERCTGRPLTQISRVGGAEKANHWKALTAEPPHPVECKRSESNASNQRKRNTEPPLARHLVTFKDFSMKFYRRRVVELALGRGLARRRFDGHDANRRCI